MNFLSNAIKFSVDKRDITVMANIVKTSLPQNRRVKVSCLVLEIKDEGIGMAQDWINSVLNNRELSQHKQEKHLGIFLCRDLVKRLHGELLIDSEVGKGTNVTIKIPIEEQE